MTKDNWQAEYLNVLSCPSRIKIVKYLKNGTKSSQQIADHLGLHRSTVARHLKVLYAAGILDREQNGGSTSYTLLNKNVIEILNLIPKGLGK